MEGRERKGELDYKSGDAGDVIIFSILFCLAIMLIIALAILICSEEHSEEKDEMMFSLALYIFATMTVTFAVALGCRPSFYEKCEQVYMKHYSVAVHGTISIILFLVLTFTLVRISYILFPMTEDEKILYRNRNQRPT